MVEAGSKQFVDYTIVRIEKATFTQFLGKDLSGNEASTLVFSFLPLCQAFIGKRTVILSTCASVSTR